MRRTVLQTVRHSRTVCQTILPAPVGRFCKPCGTAGRFAKPSYLQEVAERRPPTWDTLIPGSVSAGAVHSPTGASGSCGDRDVMNPYEVDNPILNSPFAEPARHWYIREGEPAELRPGRRPALVYPPRDERKQKHVEWSLTDGTLQPSPDYAPAYELVLVNLIRERIASWRNQGYPGVTRTTLELLQHWRRDGREKNRLFSAQLEAA